MKPPQTNIACGGLCRLGCFLLHFPAPALVLVMPQPARRFVGVCCSPAALAARLPPLVAAGDRAVSPPKQETKSLLCCLNLSFSVLGAKAATAENVRVRAWPRGALGAR